MQLSTPHGDYALDEDHKERGKCHYIFHPPPAEVDHVEELREDLTDLSAKVEFLQTQLETKSKIDSGARKANDDKFYTAELRATVWLSRRAVRKRAGLRRCSDAKDTGSRKT